MSKVKKTKDQKANEARKAKALNSLRKFKLAGQGEPVQGDEMPKF